MWIARIDIENQMFIVEDREGTVILYRQMPHQELPNPGREVLMNDTRNSFVWNKILDMVEAANEGK